MWHFVGRLIDEQLGSDTTLSLLSSASSSSSSSSPSSSDKCTTIGFFSEFLFKSKVVFQTFQHLLAQSRSPARFSLSPSDVKFPPVGNRFPKYGFVTFQFCSVLFLTNLCKSIFKVWCKTGPGVENVEIGAMWKLWKFSKREIRGGGKKRSNSVQITLFQINTRREVITLWWWRCIYMLCNAT